MIVLERKVLTTRSITAIILMKTLSLISLDRCLEVTHLVLAMVRKLYFKQPPLLKWMMMFNLTFTVFSVLLWW